MPCTCCWAPFPRTANCIRMVLELSCWTSDCGSMPRTAHSSSSLGDLWMRCSQILTAEMTNPLSVFIMQSIPCISSLCPPSHRKLIPRHDTCCVVVLCCLSTLSHTLSSPSRWCALFESIADQLLPLFHCSCSGG